MSIYNINNSESNKPNSIIFGNKKSVSKKQQPPNNTVVSVGNGFSMRIYTLYVEDRIDLKFNIPRIINRYSSFGNINEENILTFPPSFYRY